MNSSNLALLGMGLAISVSTARAATVAQWTFDETSGNVFSDYSGNNRNFTATAIQPEGHGWHRDADQAPVAPPGGRGLNGDSPRVIETASSDVFSLGKTDQLTIEFWYKKTPQSRNDIDYILNNNSTGNNRLSVWLDSGSQIWFHFFDKDGGNHQMMTPVGSITEAKGWQHIAGTFDTTSGGGLATLYIDGQAVASSNEFGTASQFNPLSATFRLMTQQGSGSGFDGNNLVDELRISNVALPSGSGTGVNELAWNASIATKLPGDFNLDHIVNAADIDLLCTAIHGGGSINPYDVDGDTLVTAADLAYEVETILATHFGDTDVDGDVDLSDLGNLATNYGTNSGADWALGDFDCDGDVDLSDLGTLATYYGQGSAQAFADFQSLTAVPEPFASPVVVVVAIATCCGALRRTKKRVIPSFNE